MIDMSEETEFKTVSSNDGLLLNHEQNLSPTGWKIIYQPPK